MDEMRSPLDGTTINMVKEYALYMRTAWAVHAMIGKFLT